MNIITFILRPNETVSYVTEFHANRPEQIVILNPDTGVHYFAKNSQDTQPVAGTTTNDTGRDIRVQIVAESYRTISEVPQTEAWREVYDAVVEFNGDNPFLADIPQSRDGFSVRIKYEDGADRNYDDSIVDLRFYNLSQR